eukprot:9502548-Pyramimonas_sp.AAC.1
MGEEGIERKGVASTSLDAGVAAVVARAPGILGRSCDDNSIKVEMSLIHVALQDHKIAKALQAQV